VTTDRDRTTRTRARAPGVSGEPTEWWCAIEPTGPTQSGATAEVTRRAKDGCKPHDGQCMPGAGLSWRRVGKAPSERPAFQPYWGKLAVRNDRGDRGNVGIIRSPNRASILPDRHGRGLRIARRTDRLCLRLLRRTGGDGFGVTTVGLSMSAVVAAIADTGHASGALRPPPQSCTPKTMCTMRCTSLNRVASRSKVTSTCLWSILSTSKASRVGVNSMSRRRKWPT